MSNSIVRRTVWTTAGVWAVLILAVMIQSMLGVTVAGARPEASRLIIMMTLPFTVGMSAVAIGAAMAIGGGGAAGGLPAGTTEMVKLHLELEGDVGEVVRVLRRIGGGDHAGGEVRDGRARPQREERTAAVDTAPERGTTATSATLAPGRWTEELAADFTASLDVVARAGDVPSVAGRCGEAGVSIGTHLARRTDLVAGGVAHVGLIGRRRWAACCQEVPASAGTGHGVGGVAAAVAANSPLQRGAISKFGWGGSIRAFRWPGFAAVASDLFWPERHAGPSGPGGLRRP